MTIKLVTICKPSAFIPMDQCETRSFEHFPLELQEVMAAFVRDGKFPATKQPEDSVVINGDGNIVITRVWLDRAAADEWIALVANSPSADVISREIVTD